MKKILQEDVTLQNEQGVLESENITKTANTKQSQKIKYMTLTGLFAAMITLMTAYICHVPTGMNGGYIHFGDSLIYIAATILPTPYALVAAAVGGGMADLLTAPMWTIATVIIKMLITIPFTNKSDKIITPRNIIAAVIAYFISGTCYFFAEYILFGTWSAFIASMSGSLIQSGGSAVFFIIFGLALDKMKFKEKNMRL